MKGVRRLKDFLDSELKEKEFEEVFEEEEIYVNLAIQVAKLRQEKGLSQKELACLLHTSPQTISRLENPSNNSLSLKTLIKVAHALNKKLKVQFV